MQKYLSSSLNSVPVSIDLENSWAAKSLQEALQLARFDARFQQKQMQEREEKLVRLYENQQQRAFDRVGRGSAGSNTSLGSTSGGGGKVRQMFDERRQKAGVDRSYPLEPLKTKTTSNNLSHTKNGIADKVKTSTIIKTQKSTLSLQSRNGKPTAVKQQGFSSVYNNVNGNETIDTYRYENNNGVKKTSRNAEKDLVEMMNHHNLRGGLSIEDEEMPNDFDDIDEAITGKLSNVGGKLPSQKVADEKPKIALGKTFRKETKPLIKKTVRPIASSPAGDHLESPNSPTNSRTENMQKVQTKCPPTSEKSTRASAKQSAKQAVCRDDLGECKYCHRRFAVDRLTVHESICSKTGKKKRKAYDATKHRLEGTELAQYTRKPTSFKPTAKQATKPATKKDWRKTHEEFIQAIRAAKEAQAFVAKGGKLSDLPPPPPSSNPDYVPCPHCGRKFNEGAAERHIPKCANFQFNKPKPATNNRGRTKF